MSGESNFDTTFLGATMKEVADIKKLLLEGQEMMQIEQLGYRWGTIVLAKMQLESRDCGEMVDGNYDQDYDK